MLDAIDLPHAAARQYIDAVAVFTALEEAQQEAAQYRGTLFWREVGGRDYLIRGNSAGGQTSLGPRTPDTEAIHQRFVSNKGRTSDRVKALRQALEQQRKLNRALSVGRVPPEVVDILNVIEAAGLGEHFLVVGTHALYAYETAASVRLPQEPMATRDVDLLLDTRKHVKFMSRLNRQGSAFIGLLQQADKTFRVRRGQKYTAVNADGFEVDIIRAQAGKDAAPHPLRLTDHEDDFWAAQVGTGWRLLGARPFSQVVVATNGRMARMRTVHPLDFVRIKTGLSQTPGRDPGKARKDALQAQVVQRLVDDYLPQLAQPLQVGTAGDSAAAAPPRG